MSDTVRPTAMASPSVIFPSRTKRGPTRRATPVAAPAQVNVHLPSSPRTKRAGAEVGPDSEALPVAVMVPVHVPAKGRRSSGDWASTPVVANADSTATSPITTPRRLTPHLPPIGFAQGTPGGPLYGGSRDEGQREALRRLSPEEDLAVDPATQEEALALPVERVGSARREDEQQRAT